MSEIPITNPQGTNEEMLRELQSSTLDYFLKEMNPETGLIPDSTNPGSPCSIAAVGLALSSYLIGVERGLLSKEDAVSRTLKALRFLAKSEQSESVTATGYRGFYYHFIDMKTGHRAWKSELSTIDTALLMGGVLSSGCYFIAENPQEKEIRALAELLYRRVEWSWALADGKSISHGWMPESGFLPYNWDKGYSEAHILYILALGSPTYPVAAQSYVEWTKTFEVKSYFDLSYMYAGPLFIHQLLHIWMDFRGIEDEQSRRAGISYFENSRRATLVQQRYAIENPKDFKHYSKHCWGFTASNGPGPCRKVVDGRERDFYGYMARGCPEGPDDGTVSPWAVVSALPFAPEIVLDTVRHAIERLRLKSTKAYGFDASFNPTFPEQGPNPNGWVSPWQVGLNQGPIVLMIENYRSGFLRELMKKCPAISNGLRLAGFRGGWLDGRHATR